MLDIEINIDEEKSAFILKGAIKELLNNRRAKFYLNDNTDYEVFTDSIAIYFEILQREKKLTKLKEALKKFGFETSNSENVKEVLKDFFDDEKKFEKFSEKARGIWNNNIDLEEFNTFKESVEQNLTNRRLYDKQLLSAFHLAFSQNACNFSVPGAGKTSVVYGAYSYLKNLPKTNNKYVNKIFIIGPLSSFGPWEDEYKECFGVKANSKRISGGITKEEREAHLLSISDVDETPEITLMSYQSVASNLENIVLYLKKKGNNVMVVLDEAHKIKNVEGGLWAQSVLSIAKYCKSRVVLSGTPLPNGFEDIYNLYNFIWPDKDIIKFHLFQLKDMTANRFDPRVKQLVNNVAPFFIRIKKSDLGLPKAIEHPPIIVKMGDIQRSVYEFIENCYVDYFQTNDEKTNDISSVLTKARFIRLLQASTNPSLLKSPIENHYSEQGLSSELFIDDKEIISKILKYQTFETPSKFIEAKKIAEQIIARGEKVIIWTTFIQNVKELQTYLLLNNIDSKLLIGEIPVESDNQPQLFETRESIIREFHNPDSSFKVIIANPFAVAESISLHKACHNAIYLERNFNASNFLQSKDRIHRVGLKPTDNINYYYILSENSIDETVHNRLVEKEKRMLEIIESQPIPLINMNQDYDNDFTSDIKAIIRDYVGRTSKI
jgi:hypothetical protein